ncbi:MAG: PKD domain-containing protein [Bacteroidota bacterium]
MRVFKHSTILCWLFLFAISPSVSAQSFYAIDFIENKGQWDGDFQFKAIHGSSTIFFNKKGYVVNKLEEEGYRNLMHNNLSIFSKITQADSIEIEGKNAAQHLHQSAIKSHSYEVAFVGANQTVNFQPGKVSPDLANYFLGGDPRKWKTGVRSFYDITREAIYDGIDMRFYSSSNGGLKYDLIVSPQTDPSIIQLKYDGVDHVKIKSGALLISTSVGEVKELEPYAYQIIDGRRVEVKCSYTVSKNIVGYKLGAYNKNYQLVIDPTLEFSTYTGSKSNNWGFSAAPGPDGSLYAGGIVFGSEYPLSLGALQTTFKGGTGQSFGQNSSIGGVDIGLTRFSNDGKQRIFSTYIGGSGDEYPHSIIVDGSGNAVVQGRTSSKDRDFPYPVGASGTLQLGPLGGASDIYVIKVSADGKVVMGSILIGGSEMDGANTNAQISVSPSTLVYNYGDHSRSEVILDKNDNVLIATSTQSDDFPVFPAGNSRFGGVQDGVVIKLTPNLSSVIFSRYLGGSKDDAAFVLSINPVTNDIYVAGPTVSADFPGDKTGVESPNFLGAVDGFISIIGPTGQLKKTTFQGTASTDFIYGIQFDKFGNPYTMGITLGKWQKRNALYGNENAKQFIAKMDPGLTSFTYTTAFGTSAAKPNISPVAFLVDRCENIYVSGWGGKLNLCDPGPYDAQTVGPLGMDVTPDAIQKYTDNKDFYFIVIEKNADKLLYGSFWGQSGGEVDHVDGGTSRFDSRGAIYMSICANCFGNNACPRTGTNPGDPITKNMIITPGAVASSNAALPGGCNLAAVKINFSFDGVDNGIKSAINGVFDTSGCSPLTVKFYDTIAMAKTYIWNFGDGSKIDTTSIPEIIHNYNVAKDSSFRIKLISIDENRCITRDSSFMQIKVGINEVEMKAAAVRVGDCSSGTFTLQNLSVSKQGKPFGAKSFVWIYDDKTKPDTTAQQSINHTFSPGLHRVWLKLIDVGFCNQFDSIPLDIYVFSTIKADFKLSKDTICIGEKVGITNNSVGGVSFLWSFSNGQTSNAYSPPDQTYSTTGVKSIKLVVRENSPGCNIADSSTKILVVLSAPDARFDFSPKPSIENTPFSFINQSTGAIRYTWNFGDGATSTLVQPIHQYSKSFTFDVTLTAFNSFGCSTSFMLPVQPIVTELLEIPNAFTPNNDGKNDIFLPKIFGIDDMNLKIYNRFGQLVFESYNPSFGWDGKFQGLPQPMDVYAFTLIVKFADGRTESKKGSVTLIR